MRSEKLFVILPTAFSGSSSIKAVAHLLITAGVPADHSDVEQKKKIKKIKEVKTASAKEQSQPLWMNLKWRVKKRNSS